MQAKSTGVYCNAAEHLVAHRGYAQCFPENTLLAIQAALDVGAKFIEIDIQLSADKNPILFHDRDLMRLCQETDAIYNYDLAKLKTFSNYSPDRFGNKYHGEQIATLTETVELLKNYPDVTLFVELKRISIEHFSMEEVLDNVLPYLEPIINQCVVISFSLEILALLRQQSSIVLGAVIDKWNDAKTKDFSLLQKINPEYFFCDIECLPRDGNLNLLSSKIVTYECTDVELALKTFERGATFIETFDIKNMINKVDASWQKQ